tara:strand:+ start:4904 stop:5461 length:558 start_codon:yes stop_codon:yes gene_type:complete
MRNIRNKLILLPLFLLYSCTQTYKAVGEVVDYFFIKDRIKTFCSRSIIELYELKLRADNKTSKKNIFFFTSSELSKLELMSKDITHIYSTKEKSEEDFFKLVEIEKNITNVMSQENLFRSCIEFINSKNKCHQKNGDDSIKCINLAQRFFTLTKISNSEIKELFPDDYIEKVNIEMINLKNYFQN